MTATTHIIDVDGALLTIPLAHGQCPGDVIRPGQRFPTPAELDIEMRLRAHRRAHGAGATQAREPLPVYRMAATLAERTPFAISIGDIDAMGGGTLHVKKRPIQLPGVCANRVEIDVQKELRLAVDHVNASMSAAYAAYRLTWIHPFADGSGRVSRAVAYAVLLATKPGLWAAHAKRIGAIGGATLTVPERIERSRAEYLAAVNAAHVETESGGGYLRFVNLDRLTAYLDRLVTDQIAGRSSAEDKPCGCA